MIATYRYQLDGSTRERKRKINCPSCGGRKTFTRYKDYETGEYISDEVGMCDRANRCSYHMKPKEWFAMNPQQRATSTGRKLIEMIAPKPPVHIPFEEMQATLNSYEENSFIKALLKHFPADKVEEAIGEYYIGTEESLNGLDKSCVFWYIDREGNIRAGQRKQFDQNCKTIGIEYEDRVIKAFWIHKLLVKRYRKTVAGVPQWLQDYEQAEKITCLYGEHLLSRYPNKPVGLVEAPKSAVVASIVYPDMVWLATTSLAYLTKARCRVLAGRKVILFPDCGIPNKRTGKTCLDEWKERVEEFKELAVFAFSTYLEDNATPELKERGFDLADLLLGEAAEEPVNIDHLVRFWGITNTPFDWVQIANASDEKRYYRILYTKEGELLSTHPELQQLADHYGYEFKPGKLYGEGCLLHIG